MTISLAERGVCGKETTEPHFHAQMGERGLPMSLESGAEPREEVPTRHSIPCGGTSGSENPEYTC
jgi:hypothetical protein